MKSEHVKVVVVAGVIAAVLATAAILWKRSR
jgi:hypothetical protein